MPLTPIFHLTLNMPMNYFSWGDNTDSFRLWFAIRIHTEQASTRLIDK